MQRLFFWVNWHAGDLILTRPLVRRVLDEHDVQIAYGCWSNQAYLVEDLPVTVIRDPRNDPPMQEPRETLLHLCPEGYLPIYLWIGSLPTYTRFNWQSITTLYNQQIEAYGLTSLKICSRYIPMLDFPPVEVAVGPNAVFVDNSVARSKHSDYEFPLAELASRYPQFRFYCAANPQYIAPNVVDCSECNLRVLSSISNRCMAIMGKGSAPFCSTLTEVNRYKPRAILRYHFRDSVHSIWDYPGNPMQYLETDADIYRFLDYVARQEICRPDRAGTIIEKPKSKTILPLESEAARLDLLLDQFERSHFASDFWTDIKVAKEQLIDFWLRVSEDQVEYAYRGAWGKVTSRYIHSRLWDLEASSDSNFPDPSLGSRRFFVAPNNGSRATGVLIAWMLMYSPERFPAPIGIDNMPDWLWIDAYRYLQTERDYFISNGASDRYFEARRRAMASFAVRFQADPTNRYLKYLWLRVMANEPLSPYVNSDGSLRELQESYAGINDAALRTWGFSVDWNISGFDSARRPKIGFLLNDLTPSAETFFNLPLFESLDSRFDVQLYLIQQPSSSLEQYAVSRAAKLSYLPHHLHEQLDYLRADDLDVLVFANDFAWHPRISQISVCRVARYQLVANSRMTSGSRAIDGFFCGEGNAGMSRDCTEKIWKLPHSGLCYSFGNLQPKPVRGVGRNCLDISDESFVFGTGLSAIECRFETLVSWSRILADVPNSILLMFPFESERTRCNRKETFVEETCSVFAACGIDPARLRFFSAEPYPSIEQLRNYLCHIDVFLDPYPLSRHGLTIELLRLSIPVVTRTSDHRHSQMSASLIEELSSALSQLLVAHSDEDYISKAIQVGRNHDLRRAINNEIRYALPRSSLFDSFAFGKQFSEMLSQILHELT
jgi:predicted O-linked N-acetylglucosamine transferase (SPINDLY family)